MSTDVNTHRDDLLFCDVYCRPFFLDSNDVKSATLGTSPTP